MQGDKVSFNQITIFLRISLFSWITKWKSKNSYGITKNIKKKNPQFMRLLDKHYYLQVNFVSCKYI